MNLKREYAAKNTNRPDVSCAKFIQKTEKS